MDPELSPKKGLKMSKKLTPVAEAKTRITKRFCFVAYSSGKRDVFSTETSLFRHSESLHYSR